MPFEQLYQLFIMKTWTNSSFKLLTLSRDNDEVLVYRSICYKERYKYSRFNIETVHFSIRCYGTASES